MSFLTALAPLAKGFLTGASALSGFLGNTAGARTSNSSSTMSQRHTSGNTGMNRRYITPEQAGLQGPLYGLAQKMIEDPAAGVAPLRTAAVGKINRTFSGAPQAIADKMLAYGGGQSGKFGKAIRQTELARRSAIGQVDDDLIQTILDRQMQGASLAERLLGMDFGSDVSTNGYSDTYGNSSGSQTGPGSPFAGGLNGGLETLSTLTLLDRLLKGH